MDEPTFRDKQIEIQTAGLEFQKKSLEQTRNTLFLPLKTALVAALISAAVTLATQYLTGLHDKNTDAQALLSYQFSAISYLLSNEGIIFPCDPTERNPTKLENDQVSLVSQVVNNSVSIDPTNVGDIKRAIGQIQSDQDASCAQKLGATSGNKAKNPTGAQTAFTQTAADNAQATAFKGPTTVYIQYGINQRQQALELQGYLNSKPGFSAPGIQEIDQQPSDPQIRFYYPKDSETADILLKDINSFVSVPILTPPTLLNGFTNLPSNTMEFWFGKHS